MKEALPLPGRITPDTLRRCVSERMRLKYLESLIPLLEQKQRECRQDIYSGIRLTQSWEGAMAHSAPGDPTAAVAARAADLETREEYRLTEQRIRVLTQERDRLRRRQQLFTCCLTALPEEQRFLVEAKILEGKAWTSVETLYENRYGQRLHRDTLRRRLTQAVQTLQEIGS